MRTLTLIFLGTIILSLHISILSWISGKELLNRYSFRIQSGDEPHYLVMINSLLNDYDLNLKNNYEDVVTGSEQMGVGFKGHKIARHTVAYENGRIFDAEYPSHTSVVNKQPREFSRHAFGMPVLHSVIHSLLFTPSYLVEPFSVLLSGLCVIGALVCMQLTAIALGAKNRDALVTSLIFLLGTPMLFYARTLLSEPLLILCSSAMFYYFATGRSLGFLPGAWLGIGILTKPVLGLIGVPLFLHLVERKLWKEALYFMIPISVCVATLLYANTLMFNHPLRFSMIFRWGTVIDGLFGLLFSWKYGLFILSPFLLAWFWSGRRWFWNYPSEAAVCTAGGLLYILLMSGWVMWHGGWGFGARLILPALPIFYYAFALYPPWSKNAPRALRFFFPAAAIISIIINYTAAKTRDEIFLKDPLNYLISWL